MMVQKYSSTWLFYFHLLHILVSSTFRNYPDGCNDEWPLAPCFMHYSLEAVKIRNVSQARLLSKIYEKTNKKFFLALASA